MGCTSTSEQKHNSNTCQHTNKRSQAFPLGESDATVVSKIELKCPEQVHDMTVIDVNVRDMMDVAVKRLELIRIAE